MTPVYQTIHGKDGNCFSACVASILDLPVKKVPNFCKGDRPRWHFNLRRWLRRRGFDVMIMEFRNRKDNVNRNVLGNCLNTFPCKHVILCGLAGDCSQRDKRPVYHSVIGKPKDRGFKIIHDPHPGNCRLNGNPFAVYAILGR